MTGGRELQAKPPVFPEVISRAQRPAVPANLIARNQLKSSMADDRCQARLPRAEECSRVREGPGIRFNIPAGKAGDGAPGINWSVKKLLIVVVAVVVLLVVFVVVRSATPVVEIPSPLASIGQATPVTAQVRDPHGVRSVQAFVEQNGSRYPVFSSTMPSKESDTTVNFTAGVKTTPQLQAGKAKLIVEATSNDLMRKSASAEREVTVITQPPSLSVDSEQHYLYSAWPIWRR